MFNIDIHNRQSQLPVGIFLSLETLRRSKNLKTMQYFCIFLIQTLFILVTLSYTDVSEDEQGGRIFRTIKYNNIWKKAVKRIDDKDDLEDLKKILRKLDKTEINLKHQKAAGLFFVFVY